MNELEKLQHSMSRAVVEAKADNAIERLQEQNFQVANAVLDLKKECAQLRSEKAEWANKASRYYDECEELRSLLLEREAKIAELEALLAPAVEPPAEFTLDFDPTPTEPPEALPTDPVPSDEPLDEGAITRELEAIESDTSVPLEPSHNETE